MRRQRNIAQMKEQIKTPEKPIRLSAGFSKETLEARKDWQEIFKGMKSRDLQPSCSA